MPHKNSSILFTLLSSMFMMMLVSILFHLPTESVDRGLKSSLLGGYQKTQLYTIHSAIDTEGILLPTTTYLSE